MTLLNQLINCEECVKLAELVSGSDVLSSSYVEVSMSF